MMTASTAGAQARLYLDSLQNSFDDFKTLVDKNYAKKVFCVLFEADIWYETGNDTTAFRFAKWARNIAKTPDEIEDCDSTITKYCRNKNNHKHRFAAMALRGLAAFQNKPA